MKRLALAFASAVLVIAGGCTKMGGQDVTLSINGDGWLVGDKSFTEDQVMDIIDGYGWLCVESKEIVDGKVTDKDFHKGKTGGADIDYYFHDGIATSYFYYGARGIFCFSNRSFKYDVKDNALIIYRGTELVGHLNIVDINDKQFCAVEYVGWKSDGTKVFKFATYRKMSDKELKAVQEQCAYDQDLL